MTDFITKWQVASQDKNSTLCVGLDPAQAGQRQQATLNRTQDKISWTLNMVATVAPYAAAIKLNRNYYKDISQSEMAQINRAIHDHDMLSIDDSKLADIGDTNDAGLFHAAQEGFDAVTYAPFPGNIESTARSAKERNVGLIMLVLMSNPEFAVIKKAQIGDTPAFAYFAEQARKHQVEGVVIGAPSPRNHISQSDLDTINERLDPKSLVLVPGIGAQGGDLTPILQRFDQRAILNVGRSIVYAPDPAAEARNFRDLIRNKRLS
jgi:orotidine-5'-phosphate decarboxylase